jgi:hypothetical protein
MIVSATLFDNLAQRIGEQLPQKCRDVIVVNVANDG